MVQNLDLYLGNVDSFVKDDDRLVTYKWLSRELEVHVNVAKEILQHYYDSHKDKIVATFLVKGQLKDGSLRMEVTRASDLDTMKQKFSRLDFEHIYSVQRTLPDIELLANAGNGDARYSAIKLAKCPLRAEGVSRTKPEDTKKVEKIEKKVEQNNKDKPKVEEKLNEEKENANEKVEKEKTKVTKTDSLKGSAKGSKKPVQSTQTGYKNLFGKVGNQKKEEVKKPPPVQEEKKPVEQSKKDDNLKKSAEKPKTTSKSSTSKKPQSKKRNRSPSEKETGNKRKRIVVVSDSSGDEEMKSDHSEDDEEPIEIVQESSKTFSRKSPSPEPMKIQSGKVKIRKVVSQSCEDDDGYVVTKQVTVIEEVDAKPEPAPKPKPEKVEPPAEKKQASITNFFKRS